MKCSKMAAEPEKKPVKGILKHTSSLDKASKREVEWDEMNILATFHPPGKDYGHMKVDEPPTPYNKYSDAEDDEEGVEQRRGSASNLQAGLDPSVLASRLEEEGTHHKTTHIVDPEEEDSSADENETPEERAKRKAFELKRKLHYNEFAAVQLAKKLMSEEDDEDDEEEEEGSSKPEENSNQNTSANASMAEGSASAPTEEAVESETADTQDSVQSDVNMVSASESG